MVWVLKNVLYSVVLHGVVLFDFVFPKAFLAEKHIVHRDLRTRNVLVGEKKLLKICDFGLTRDVYEDDMYIMQDKQLLPVKWMAPESLLYGQFTLESDV